MLISAVTPEIKSASCKTDILTLLIPSWTPRVRVPSPAPELISICYNKKKNPGFCPGFFISSTSLMPRDMYYPKFAVRARKKAAQKQLLENILRHYIGKYNMNHLTYCILGSIIYCIDKTSSKHLICLS